MGFNTYMNAHTHAARGDYDMIYSVRERQKMFPEAEAAARAEGPREFTPTEHKPSGLKRAWLKLIGREKVWIEDVKPAMEGGSGAAAGIGGAAVVGSGYGNSYSSRDGVVR